MLLFKKKFLDSIRAGCKTQTIRLWKHRMMRDGQRSYIPGVGYIRIREVVPVRLDQLTQDDAVLDGFDSLRAMREELTAIYGERLNAGYRTFRIRFEILPPHEQKKQPPAHGGSTTR